MKKFIAILLALLLTVTLMLSVTVASFAASEDKRVAAVQNAILNYAEDIANIKISYDKVKNYFPTVVADENIGIDQSEFEYIVQNDSDIIQTYIVDSINAAENTGTEIGENDLANYMKLAVGFLYAETLAKQYGKTSLDNEYMDVVAEAFDTVVMDSKLYTEIFDDIVKKYKENIGTASQASIFSDNAAISFLVVIVVEAIAIVALIVMNRRKTLILQKNGLLAEKE